jgi:hypothetical protein
LKTNPAAAGSQILSSLDLFRPTRWACNLHAGRWRQRSFCTGGEITEESTGSGRLIFRAQISALREGHDPMNKYLAIGLIALGLAAFTPQPAKAGFHVGVFVGPPAYYYPGYYSDYYYGYPYYYGPRYHYWYYNRWRYRHYHGWHHRHHWD